MVSFPSNHSPDSESDVAPAPITEPNEQTAAEEGTTSSARSARPRRSRTRAGSRTRSKGQVEASEATDVASAPTTGADAVPGGAEAVLEPPAEGEGSAYRNSAQPDEAAVQPFRPAWRRYGPSRGGARRPYGRAEAADDTGGQESESEPQFESPPQVEQTKPESIIEESGVAQTPPYQPGAPSGEAWTGGGRPPRRRHNRSRSGGARHHAAPPSAAPEIAAPPAEVAPAVTAGPSPLEAALARQTAIIDSLIQGQLTTLSTIQELLATISRRLESATQSPAAQARVGIFVDVPNIVYAAERFGITIDFGRLLEYLTHGRQLVRASAYAPISDDPHMPLATQRFVQPFVRHGYRIVTKPLKRFGDGTIKANFDIELAMDVLTMADRLDVVCLVSGDGDFRRLVELVSSRGVRVEVVAFAQSTAAELRAICDSYIDLGQHLDDIRVR